MDTGVGTRDSETDSLTGAETEELDTGFRTDGLRELSCLAWAGGRLFCAIGSTLCLLALALVAVVDREIAFFFTVKIEQMTVHEV